MTMYVDNSGPLRRSRARWVASAAMVSACAGMAFVIEGTSRPAPAMTAAVGGRVLPARGAGTVGSADFSYPSNSVFVSRSGSDAGGGTLSRPYATISHAVAVAPAGATVVVRAGTYHENVTFPYRKRLTLQNFPHEAVWLDGAEKISGWVQDGNAWRRDNWALGFDISDPTAGAGPNWAMVSPAHPVAGDPAKLYLNGRQLVEVKDRSSLTAGTFYVDRPGRRIYLGSNPNGSTVEVSDLPQALYVNGGSGSVIRGIGVRRYATPLKGQGTVKLFADNVTMDSVVVQDTATRGVGVDGTGVTVRRSTLVGNGQLGLGAHHADRLLVEDSVIDGNNTEQFNMAPEAGGLKMTSSRYATIRNDSFSTNNGAGLWIDESCYRATAVSSTMSHNTGYGAHVEISGFVTFADNTVADNRSSGLRIAESNDVEVWQNTVVRNRIDLDVIDGPRVASNLSTPGHDSRYGVDPNVTWVVRNVHIHNNIVASGQVNSPSLMAVEDGTRQKKGGQMVSADADAYYRPAQAAPSIVVSWANYGASPSMLVFPSLSQFRATAGMEGRGIERVGGTDPFLVSEATGDYRTSSSSPGNGRGLSLPTAVAAAIGVPAGGSPNIGRLSQG